MSITLAEARVELSKQLGDYLAGTVTTGGDKTSLIDSQLIQYHADWINNWTWDFMTGTTNSGEERRIDTLLVSTGDCTLVTAHTASVAIASTYEIHRLFQATKKRQALIAAARLAFPDIHEKIWDETMVSGNWLKDGSFEIWTDSSSLTHWTETGSTLTQTSTTATSTVYYFKHGAYSCKVASGIGSLQQTITNWDDLKRLAGKAVTFTVQGWCDTADCLRISIDDGVTETFSDHHDGDDVWTPNNDPLSVTATIADSPVEIAFRIHHDVESGGTETSYVDDARVICGNAKPRLYIAHLGLAQEMPHQVFIEPSDYSLGEPWALVHNASFDTENGYLYLPDDIPNDYRLRIKGLGYLDFLASGVSSTAWTATINIDAPQTDILMAQAALYLYTEMAMPNFSSGDRKDYQEMMGFWKGELRERIGKHGMPIPSVPTKWR